MSRVGVSLAAAVALLAACACCAAASDWKSDMAKMIPACALDEGHWWVLSSFEWVKEGREFWGDRPLPPDNSFDLTKTYEGRKGTAKWVEVPEWDEDGKVYTIADKSDIGEDPEGCVAAYLYRRVDSPAETDAILYFGFDDGLVLNLNGKVIFQKFFYWSAHVRQEAIPIHLKKGRNDFLFKIIDKDNTSDSGICFDIRPAVSPEKYARALETLIGRYPDDRENVLDAKMRLVQLYRQMGQLRKADSLATAIGLDPAVGKERKEAIVEYNRSRPAGIGTVSGYSLQNGRATFTTARGTLHIAFWRDTAPRITFVPSGTAFPYPASQRPLPVPFDRKNGGKIVTVKEEPARFVVHGAKLNVEVPKDGSGVVFVNGKNRRFLELGMLDEFKKWEWSELKTFKGPYEYAVLHLNTREAVFGTGERYDFFNRRGRANPIGNSDRAYGDSHFTLPYFTTQGHDALFINSFGDGDMNFDLPNAENMAVCRIQEDVADIFYFVGTPKSLVRQWVDLTGHTVMPPDWTLGVWMSRNSYEDENVVLDVAKKLREYKVPASVLVMEAWRGEAPNWMKWDAKNWPNREQMCKTLHEMGYKLIIWTMQFHGMNLKSLNPSEQEALDNKYFVMEGDHPWGWSEDDPGGSFIVDFFNPAACAWWDRQYRPLFDPVTGIDALKTDIGENNGGQTWQGWKNINNIYALGYLRCAWEMTRDITGHGVVFARTGTVGTQQYPILWAGDHSTWFQGLQEAMNAMLTTGLEGYAWTSFDVGGLYGDLDKETYIRMAQVGAFCPILQAHGQGNREPYEFGQEAVDIFNRYANWYLALKPYRIAAGQEACKTGVPIMRPLWMEYPDDPECYDASYQYFFGRDILVAPIISYNHTRSLYLPKGEWVDWWTGERVKGGRHLEVEMPLDKMPLYVRPGSSVLKIAPGVSRG